MGSSPTCLLDVLHLFVVLDSAGQSKFGGARRFNLMKFGKAFQSDLGPKSGLVASRADRHIAIRIYLSSDSESTARKIRRYLPLVTAWVLEQERFILENGVPLTEVQLADAKLVGVAKPERVRLFRVEQIPIPEHAELAEMKEAMKLTAVTLPGLSLRYGIYVRASGWGQRRVVVHELAHSAQYERLDGIRAFLEGYLFECLGYGFTSPPLVQAALAHT